MKVYLPSLDNVVIPALRVRSLDLGLYTVEIQLSDGWAVLCEESGQVMRFTGLEWVRRKLSHLQVERASLHHASAYHEMIGLEEEQVTPLDVVIAWPGESH
ncbi:MAG: hypothetical protein CVV10_05455 [Gammaproteobacteria bacterium HGW-Gammaproteobacteria-14]|nr:MAG: hypothetical protein CVV10_05455 [Gammaproteobacteria bacterium HGW-Gammaproteobacteria-14]